MGIPQGGSDVSLQSYLWTRTGTWRWCLCAVGSTHETAEDRFCFSREPRYCRRCIRPYTHSAVAVADDMCLQVLPLALRGFAGVLRLSFYKLNEGVYRF